jgi:WD40 repeat protein
MALGFTDGSLQFVDSTTGEMIRELTLGGHIDGITCLAFSTDGLRVVSGSHDAKLVVWDALTGTWLAHMNVHMRSITSVVWLESDSAKKKSGAPPHTWRHCLCDVARC